MVYVIMTCDNKYNVCSFL